MLVGIESRMYELLSQRQQLSLLLIQGHPKHAFHRGVTYRQFTAPTYLTISGVSNFVASLLSEFPLLLTTALFGARPGLK